MNNSARLRDLLMLNYEIIVAISHCEKYFEAGRRLVTGGQRTKTSVS